MATFTRNPALLTDSHDIVKALALALHYHKDQKDKNGKPYMGHLLRVAARVADEPSAFCAALLHDIIEDTPIGWERLLNEGFHNEVIQAVSLLTKNTDITYMENIKQIKYNRLATKVKLADLADNMDPSRKPPGDDFSWMLGRYGRALAYLEDRPCFGEDQLDWNKWKRKQELQGGNEE